jgi:hypothetical protein
MSRHDPLGAHRPATLFIAGFALAAVAVVAIAAGPLARSAAAPEHSAPPSAMPSAPAARPTAATPSDAPGPVVDLRTVDDSDVSVSIVDRTGALVSAVSGQPGEGMSVEGRALDVVNVGERTLRLTWIDFGIDNRLTLFVDAVDGHLRLALIQPEPTGPADAMGFDRVLDLTFDRPVEAATVEAILQDGVDTPG